MSAVAVLILSFVVAVVLALALTPLIRRVALAVGAVDVPEARKIHTEPVPRMGGVAVALAAAATVGLYLLNSHGLDPAALARWATLGAAFGSIVLLGAVDDARGLSARLKLALEIAAATVVVLLAGVPTALDLSPFFGRVELGVAGPALGVLWIVTLSNALNMTDVVDGVAGGLAAIAAATLAVVALLLGHQVAPVVLLAVSGALVGFLPHNFRRPRVFLGDAGSLGVGFLLGAASLVGLESGGAWLVLPAFLALGLPLAECGLTVLRRTLRALRVVRTDRPRERFSLRMGRPGLFTPDRRHIPHRLLELGLSKPAAVATLYAVAGALGALACATLVWPWVGPVAGFVLLAAAAYFAPRWLYEELRVLDRGALLPFFEQRVVRNRLAHAGYDALAVATAYLVAHAVADGTRQVLGEGTALWLRCGAVTAAALAGFWAAGLYRSSYRRAGLRAGLRAGWAVVFGVVLAAGAAGLALGSDLRFVVWALFAYLVLTAVVGARLSFRLLDDAHQRSRVAGRRALIFGAGRGGELALREMLSNPALGLVPLGFVDDDPETWRRDLDGYPIYPGGEDVLWLLRRHTIQDLVVSTQKIEAARLDVMADVCRKAGVRLLQFRLQWDEAAGNGSVGRKVDEVQREVTLIARDA